MARNSKGHRRHRGPKGGDELRIRSDQATPAQVRFIEGLREKFDPLSVGSQIARTKVGAGAEIARLLQLKLKYEAMTREPHPGRPKGSGQYRYPKPRGETHG